MSRYCYFDYDRDYDDPDFAEDLHGYRYGRPGR